MLTDPRLDASHEAVPLARKLRSALDDHELRGRVEANHASVHIHIDTADAHRLAEILAGAR